MAKKNPAHVRGIFPVFKDRASCEVPSLTFIGAVASVMDTHQPEIASTIVSAHVRFLDHGQPVTSSAHSICFTYCSCELGCHVSDKSLYPMNAAGCIPCGLVDRE